MIWLCLLLLVIVTNTVSSNNKNEICSAQDIADTDIADRAFQNSEPAGSVPAVKRLKQYNVKTKDECIKKCCSRSKCDAVSIDRHQCILYHCHVMEACKPKKMSGLGPNILYIVLSLPFNRTKNSPSKKNFDEDSQLCELSVPENCPKNSICKRIQEDKRTGVCVCMAGFMKGPSGCVEAEKEHQRTEDKIHKISNWNSSHSISTNENTTTTPPKPATSPTPTTVTKGQIQNLFAHAGPNLHVHVSNPRTSSRKEIVTIFGSATNNLGRLGTDDVSFHWKRDISSLSVGDIVNNSDHNAILMLTNLLQGQYKFVLTVADKNGGQSSDSVTLYVTEKPDERFGNLVDILFESDIYKFTEQESINFSTRMEHVIEKNMQYNSCKVHVTSVSGTEENKTLISFYAEAVDPTTKENQILFAGKLEENLKKKLTENKFIFDFSVSKFQSKICYNTCGGHGRCCSVTHRCMCTLPWMNNPWHERSTGFPNCDMHVMIIVVICVATLFMSVLLFLTMRTVFRIFRRKRRYGKDVLRYKLLDNSES